VVPGGYGLEGGMLEGRGDWRDERDTAAWMESCWEKMRDLDDKKDTATVNIIEGMSDRVLPDDESVEVWLKARKPGWRWSIATCIVCSRRPNQRACQPCSSGDSETGSS